MTAAAPGAPGGPRARSRWALALRLSRREARRHPWRHLLVVLMIVVPVLAAFAAYSGISTYDAVHRLDREHELQGADLRVEFGPSDPALAVDGAGLDLASLRDSLPVGTHLEHVRLGADYLFTPTQETEPALAGTALVATGEGSRAADRYLVDRGRRPSAPDEVWLSEPLAAAGGWGVGDRVESARSGLRFTVTGIGRVGDDRDAEVALVGDGVPEDLWAPNAALGDGVSMRSGAWLDGVGREQLLLWGGPGATPARLTAAAATQVPVLEVSDGTGGGIDRGVGLGITIAAAGVATIVAVVASAAFAVGARRQLRDVGLLATAGAEPGLVRAALVLQGAVPGALAGVLAVLAGWAAGVAANRTGIVARVSGVEGARIVPSVGGAVLAVALGTAAGVVAAWVPARAASRIPVLSALAGRRPVGPVPARVPVAGAALCATGFVLLSVAWSVGGRGPSTLATVVPILGVIAFVLGAVAVAPLLVAGLGPLAGRATGTLRLVLRGLVRHRAQSAATVAAVAVALALPVGLLTALPDPDRWDDDPAEEVVDAFEVLAHPTSSVTVDLGAAPWTSETGPQAVAATTEELVSALGDDTIHMARTLALDDAGRIRIVGHLPTEGARALLAGDLAERLADGGAIDLDGAFAAPGGAIDDPDSIGIVTGDGEVVSLPRASLPGGPILTGSLQADLLVAAEHPRHDDLTGAVVGAQLLRPGGFTGAERRALHRIADPDPVPTLAELRAGRGRDAPDPSAPPEVDVWVTDDLRSDTSGPDRPREVGLLRAATAGATVVALLVLTITLTLRAVDGEDDRRVALAVGAPPARLRRQRALEGTVLATLGALLALPLGWLPVVAVRSGLDDDTVRRAGWSGALDGPGVAVVAVLVPVVVLVGVLWWVVPTARAAVRRRPEDLLLPRT